MEIATLNMVVLGLGAFCKEQTLLSVPNKIVQETSDELKVIFWIKSPYNIKKHIPVK